MNGHALLFQRGDTDLEILALCSGPPDNTPMLEK